MRLRIVYALLHIIPSPDSDDTFIVFHLLGYTVYDPHHCYMRHEVRSSFSHFAHPPSASSLPTLCEVGEEEGEEGRCAWGSVVTVRNQLAYVSQPELNRVVVVSLVTGFNPIEVSF